MDTETAGFLPSETAVGLGLTAGFLGSIATLFFPSAGAWPPALGLLAGLASWLFLAWRARMSAGRFVTLTLVCLGAAGLTLLAGYLCGAAMDAVARGLFAQDG